VQHCEQDTLALLALGEPAASPEDDHHLVSCTRCQSELASLRAVVTVGRQVTPADHPVSPPPAVWDRITAELGIAPGPRTFVPDQADVSGPKADAAATPRTGESVVALDERRSARWKRRTALLTAAAAVVGVLAGVVGAGLVRSSGPEDSSVVATAELKPLSAASASGTASMHRSAAGESLSVQITGLRQVPDGFYEVWLADTQTKKMISVGVLDASDRGSFDVPAGLDLTEYRVVDVSLEAFDGNPQHSAVSVVRGAFPA
jgi:hypothetical protein